MKTGSLVFAPDCPFNAVAVLPIGSCSAEHMCLFHLGGCVVERALDAGADRGEGGDAGNRNEGGYQAIFNGRCPAGVAQQVPDGCHIRYSVVYPEGHSRIC